MSKTSQSPPHRAIRLVLQYDGRKLEVIQRQNVEMAPPPSDAVRGYDGQSGFWYELRDAKGRVLYRRIVDNPIGGSVEAHDPEKGPRRYDVKKPHGVLVAVVPDMPDADALVVMSSPLDPAKSAGPAEPLAKIALGGTRRAR